MRVTFSKPWVRKVGPTVEQKFPAGWSGYLPDDVARSAIEAVAAEADGPKPKRPIPAAPVD